MVEQPPRGEQFDFDRSVLGVDTEVARATVTAEDILAFCATVGETNPLYTDAATALAAGYRGLVAPPAYYSIINEGSGGPDPKVTFGTVSFAAGQHCAFMEPICAGDTIVATTRIVDVYAKTGRSGMMVFVVRRTVYENQLGQQVAEVEQLSARRNMPDAGEPAVL